MRVQLRLRGGPQDGAARVTDLAEPFSIGTAPDALWQIRAAGGSEGGTAILQLVPGGGVSVTGAGSVVMDGQPVAGQPAPLGHGALLLVAGQPVELRIETAGASLSHDAAPLSISAILSDVAPGGEAAAGPLPGEAETGSPLDAPASHRPAAERYWQEPRAFEQNTVPLPTSERGAAILPDNWAAEWDQGGMLSDRSHQSAAGLARTNVNPAGAGATLAAARAAEGDDDQPSARAEAALGQALAALARIEDELSRQLADLGAPLPPRPPVSPEASPQAITRQAERIIAGQAAIGAACRAALEDAATRLDPEAIATASAANPSGGLIARVAPAVSCWAEYQARIAPQGQPGPLSQAALTRQLRLALGQPQPQPDQTKDKT
ncbi:MAG: hypothetical protein Q4F71_01370 [Paracoccus sp. (in: a-proteobacteria)]|nr:hypothetical protein [Paracoccus sp. (in: a-proteobacteria)]